MTTQTQDRWTEIRAIWQSNQALFVIAGFLAGLLAYPALQALSTDAWEFLSSFVPEAAGIAFTVLLIERLNQRREDHRRIRELQERLLRDVRSPENAVVKQAIHELREHGWLTGKDGLLKGANLVSVNLAGVNLSDANLEETDLHFANLAGAKLFNANLERANLHDANLQGAFLVGADLQGADLSFSNLMGVSLMKANLTDVNLSTVNLAKANLEGAVLQRAYLKMANLQDANLFGANLAGARFGEVKLVQFDLLLSTHLALAGLEESTFQSNLEGANLSHVQINKETIFPDGSKWSPDLTRAELSGRFGVVFESTLEWIERKQAKPDNQAMSE